MVYTHQKTVGLHVTHGYFVSQTASPTKPLAACDDDDDDDGDGDGDVDNNVMVMVMLIIMMMTACDDDDDDVDDNDDDRLFTWEDHFLHACW